MAHILERAVMTAMFSIGASVGFYSGDPKMLLDDIGELKPTILVGVPRVFDRIYQNIMATVDSSFFKKFFFHRAYEAKKKGITQHVLFEDAEKSTPFYNRFVFNSIKNKFGGHIRIIVSGGGNCIMYNNNVNK